MLRRTTTIEEEFEVEAEVESVEDILAAEYLANKEKNDFVLPNSVINKSGCATSKKFRVFNIKQYF